LKFLDEQIHHNPNSSAPYLFQGQVFSQTKQNESAEGAFAHAVELDHSNLTAVVLLAQTRTSLKKYDQAIADYQKAIELSPHDPRFFVALGTLFEKKREWEQARDNYQKALAIKPDEPLAANNLAYLLLEHQGDVTVALSLAQTARKGLPNLPNSADTLGWAYYHTGAYSAAVPLFETAVKAVPDNQAYRYHLGMTYEKLKDPGRAKAELEKAISLDPKSPVAEQARQAISTMHES
jgi:cellulose synthase operon protein C